MKDRGIITTCLLFPLSKVTNPYHTIQFELVKDPNSNRVNDFLMKKTIPVILNDNFLIFRYSNIKFQLKGTLLKLISNKNSNVDLAKLPDRKKVCMILQRNCILIARPWVLKIL